jgi:cob(I)alamin adenosyltransferase
MKIYTARGDTGSTDLLGERVGKDDPRIDLLGDLDEATSTIGL